MDTISMYRGGFGTLETSEMEFLMTMVNSLKQLGSITKKLHLR